MENGNGCTSGNGVLIAVSTSSEDFQSNILAPLRCAYLYEESKRSFRYNSAVLIKNPEQEKKYNAFRAKRRELGYSEEDLEESYGFLVFDDTSKANTLGETGLLTGNSTCTTLGDPTKGVYISVYSDCLAPNRWYHGKTGYIVIIKLTKGRVKQVLENYTRNLTPPTEGFDCHVSEQFPTVSAKTSSFLAFERAQYYIYELLDGGSDETVQSPSAACPFAIVSFSYTDTKATFVEPPEISEEIKLVCHYFPWRGQLQIGNHFYDVGLRSAEGATIPVELPPVVKVDRAISMLDLRQLLPKTVFETYYSGEVFLDDFYCSLYRLVSSEVEQNNAFSLLLCEIKKKDVALTIPLSDGGFLFLLHPSHFLTYNDSEVLQGMFVFPESRVIHRETKIGCGKPVISAEILQALPVLTYAEGEVEKSPIDQSEELCEVFVQHMQNYAAIISPELALSPSREVSIFPDQYDVPHALKNLYSSPEWTNGMWQNLRSYLSKPVSFQLPVSKASEILSTGQEEQMEDLDDDVYFCPSSPEEAPADNVSIGSEEQLTGQKSALNVGTSLDSCISRAEAQVDLTAAPQGLVLDDLQPGDVKKDTEKSDLNSLTKSDDIGTKNLETPSTSDDLPAELIVSISSAERTATDGNVIIAESKAKLDFQLSGFTLDDETVTTKISTLKKPKRRKLRRRNSKSPSKPCVKTSSLQPVKITMEDDNLTECQPKDSSGHPQLNNPSNTYLRKLRKRKFGKPTLRNKMVTRSTVVIAVAEENESDPGQQSIENPILMASEACPPRKKIDRWDLKPVVSECGRILVPHGCLDVSDHIINALNNESQPRKDETSPEKMMGGVSVDAPDTGEMGQESTNAPETTVDKREATTSKGDGNHPENAINHLDPEHSVLRQPADEKDLTLNPDHSEHFSKNNGSDSPLQTVHAKCAYTPSPARRPTKGEFLLNKLKSVLLRGKRKTAMLLSKETIDAAQNTEPCFKKGKVDSRIEALVQDPNVGIKEVSTMVSVDPNFAYALGLTPRETPDQMHKSEDLQTQKKRKDVLETKEEKQPEIVQSPLSIFPQRGRIKMLKKHQGISAEFVKKKWWLHFQTPGFASEKLKYKEDIQEKSHRKAVKEKSNSAYSPTDALNLLADLALSASHDQVPPQPDQALEGKPETNLKKRNRRKAVTSVEQESVLHALLRQAAARHLQPELPSSNHLVRDGDMAGLVSKEHAYSLPLSSSVLLDLLTPLGGSTSTPHNQTMNCDGFNVPHPSVNQEDKTKHNNRTPEHLKKRVGKFRHSRSFVNKDGSVQVTKHWKENYDFNLDSKFTNDSKCSTICRALHGPWDFSIQETSKEVRFIFHMWIGLFYSKSTARFFDSDCTDPCSEESDPSEVSSGMTSAPAQPEFKADSRAPCLNATSASDALISNALDLRKKDTSILAQGSVILDLSQRNSRAERDSSDLQVNKKETSVSGQEKETSDALNTLGELQKASTFQFCRNTVDSTEIIKEANDVRRTSGIERMCAPLQKAGCTVRSCVPSFQCGGTLLPVPEKMEKLSFQPENHLTASRIGCVLHGCNDEKTEKKDGTRVSEGIEMCLLNKDVDSYKKVGDAVHTVEHEEMESKYVENWEEKEKPVPEGGLELPTKRTRAGDPRDVENWEEKEKPVPEGGLELPAKRTHAGDPRDVENWEEKEKPVPEGGLELPAKRTHAGDPRDVENWEEKDKPVPEGSLELPAKRTHAGDPRDVENWEEKEKPVPEGGLEFPTKRTHAGDPRDVENWKEKEKPVPEGGLELPAKRTHAGDPRDVENWEEKDKPVPEGSLELPAKRTHAGDPRDVENWEEKEKPVPEGGLEFPTKRTRAGDPRDVENWEEKEKPVPEGGLELPTKRTRAGDPRDVENWEEKEKPVPEGGLELPTKRTRAGDPRDVENWEEQDKPVPEGGLELPTKRTRAGDPRDVENWEEQDKPVPEGGLELLTKRTHAGDPRDVENWEEQDKPVPEGGLELPTKRTRAGDPRDVENWEEQDKPVPEGGLELPTKRTHAGDPRDVENWEEKEKPVPEGGLELPTKRTHAADPTDVDNWEKKENPVEGSSQPPKRTRVGHPRDVENWEEKEKPFPEGSMELSPKRIHTGTHLTNEISGIICNGNILENEKQLSGEEPEAISLDKAKNVKQGVDCWTVDKDTVNKNDVKECLISDLETGNDLNDPPLPMMCDGSDTIKNDSFTDHQAPLEEQPPQADNEKSAYDDLLLQMLRVDGHALTDEHSILEKACQIPSQKGHIDNEPAVEENCENGLADLRYQLLRKCDGPDPIKEYTESKGQTPLVHRPSQAVSKEDVCCDLQILKCKSKLYAKDSALTNEIDISEKSSHASSEIRPVWNKPVEENLESHASSVDNTYCHKAALLTSDERQGSVDGSSANGFIPQTNKRVETGSQNKAINSEGDDWDTKSDEGGQNVENTLTEQFNDQSDSVKMFEVDVALTKEADLKSEQTNKGLEKIHSQVVIPFIGIDNSGENAVQLHDSEGKVEEVRGQKETLFITDSAQSDTLPPTEVSDSSQMYSEKPELSAGRALLSLPDVTEIGQPQVSGSESDNRCPTPTMDEEPFQYDTCYGPTSSGNSSSSSSFFGSKTFKKPPHHFHPDVDLRTQRVLQSIDKFLSKSSHTNKSGQIETADMKHSLDQTDELQKISIGKDYYIHHRSFHCTKSLQAFKRNMNKDIHKTPQRNLSHELNACSQRPVMAVKPSKGDEIQANCKLTIESSQMSNSYVNNPTRTSTDLDTTPALLLSEKKTGNVKGNSAGQNPDKHEASELFAKCSWLSDVSKFNSDKAKFALLNPLYENEDRDFSKFNKSPPSSPPMQSFELSKTSKCDGNQSFGQITEESFEANENRLHASTSAVDYKDDDIIEDGLFLEPRSSLTCTIFNTSQKRSDSFLEQLSKRCLQNDLTQASVEQECLIFSEQMKQLLKRSKREPKHQMDAHDKLNLSCSSPMTVHFSILEDQEDTVEHFDVPSLFGLKIKVDMSNKRDLADTTEEENTLLPPKLSKNPVEHTGVSGVTAECAGLYTAMMDDVCAAKKAPSRPAHFRMERGHPKTEPRQHFGFCEQITRERDDCFRSSMNSVVKRHCKTKYRFYVLVTSDDPFFEETKAQLEADGHTAVQPSEFFHCEHSSSSLLIILRNEDIAEHICEVPHLLRLRKSPTVQFAGIDEPDDVVNLTHQELFMRGGFIMFHRSALESLSLCNMKTMSEILQELRRTGKWKWMLHYRDSRWLKENARLSAEAKEKKRFINWCQEVGILEVLPYHECDHLSRDQPDYLTCLVRLQVQNISARYPVFITDTTDDSFGANGILSLTPSSILTCSPSETFT